MNEACKRLIEVDLPIKRISAHARREKSIRHGHISTLHIWWARRPLAACRAVICAALWPDPADPDCSESFLKIARAQMHEWATMHIGRLSAESKKHFVEFKGKPKGLDDGLVLRRALLDFIADFADWDNSTVKEFLATSRALTQAAHEALGGEPGTKPLVVDPFAGGGSIPLEALRVGADAFASDLNPVAVLLNKVVLEYIPKYGRRLADEVRKWGEWIKKESEKELAEFYPKDPDSATPIAYLWARTIKCEGPGCGADVPLMRSLWLAKKANRSTALRIVPDAKAKRVGFEIIPNAKASDVGNGTVARGSATCPCCGYTTPVKSVRSQLKERRGGAADARLFCVVTTKPSEQGRFYRLPNDRDLKFVQAAAAELEKRKAAWKGELSLVPEELTPRGGGSGAGRAFSQRNYGMEQFCDLFTPRQLLSLTTLGRHVREVGKHLAKEHDAGLAEAIQCCLAMAVARATNQGASLSKWNSGRELVDGVFARQALSMLWDFGEMGRLFSEYWLGALDWISAVVAANVNELSPGQTSQNSATAHPLPDDSADYLITDPPYYDAVPYSDLSDYFYVWLKRTLPSGLLFAFQNSLTPKKDECIVDEIKLKDRAYFERTMAEAMSEGRRVLKPHGVGVVVFAHKSTTGWESQLQAMVDAGWTMTGSWSIDTEMENRLRAQDSAALASSVHIVCRPREDADGNVRSDEVGDWRDVLHELPGRMHEWMPRLANEGVVGADAIFACLGPALEIFSRYSRVEKPSGEQVTLKEYLEHVWAAVSKEALNMIFAGADATGFEPDARLTAMWLWTLSTGGGNGSSEAAEGSDDESVDEDEEGGGKPAAGGFVLEYDAARKIAQGLGVHLEQLGAMVEVKGDKARLLSVSERVRTLLGKPEKAAPANKRRKTSQKTLFDVETEVAGLTADSGGPAEAGATVLDRVHQSMLLFGTGRSEALKRFLVEDGVGRDERLWRLAQALSALYPSGTEEKRWVDGVLARKKGLGF